jgi:uncharacterized coiled-coil protein SlyX|tara:strand:- start:320 stop:511 length:192 start_codon:yes stop_codon:yes gene_type:complete
VCSYLLIGLTFYVQVEYNRDLEKRVAELEKTVVVKDQVIENIAEQLGDELALFYKKMMKSLEN